MENNNLQMDFLLGAVSPMGFQGHFHQILGVTGNNRSVLIKAGPGCGKSTLMKKVAAGLQNKGYQVECIHCSSDPDSLDGIICPEKGISMADATAPHCVEPRYPVASEEVLSLYHLLDREKLRAEQSEVIALFQKCSQLQGRAARYIAAAGALLSDTMRVGDGNLDYGKTKKFAQTLSKKYIPDGTGKGTECCRLLSANTCKGLVFYKETIEKTAEAQLIVLEDHYGAAAKYMMRLLREDALKKGHKVITCYCPTAPHEKIDHILLPELKIAFTTANAFHNGVNAEQKRTVHCSRFFSENGIIQRKERIRFNQKAAKELYCQASSLQMEAKRTHDMLESYYSKALDFEALNRLTDEFIKTLGI